MVLQLLALGIQLLQVDAVCGQLHVQMLDRLRQLKDVVFPSGLLLQLELSGVGNAGLGVFELL